LENIQNIVKTMKENVANKASRKCLAIAPLD